MNSILRFDSNSQIYRITPNGFVFAGALAASLSLSLSLAACGGGSTSERTDERRAAPLLAATQQATLSPSDATYQNLFGRASAIDGDTVAVFGQQQDGTSFPEPKAAVYVFTRSATGWEEQQIILPSDTVEDDEVALALDGDTIAMGTKYGVYIFVRSGTTWTQQQKLPRPSTTQDTAFGDALAIDGDTLVVGAPNESTAGSYAGAAYVFTRSGGTWTQTQKMFAADAAKYDGFGFAVAVEGDRIAVGSDGDDDRGEYTGSAYLFARSSTGWTQQQKLLPAGVNAGDQFGGRLALKGGTLAVGSPGDDSKATDAGAVYIFTESNATWSEQAKLVANDASADLVMSMSLAVDGSTVIAGVRPTDVPNAGAAYTFERSAEGTWSQAEKLIPSDPQDVYYFGYSVGVSGTTRVVGAPIRGPSSGHGAAYIFVP